MAQKLTPSDVSKIALLANIPVSEEEKASLALGFTQTLEVVEKLQSVKTSTIEPTHQVTGLENVFREDVVDTDRMFSQEQALTNGKHVHDGFFVVNQVIDQE